MIPAPGDVNNTSEGMPPGTRTEAVEGGPSEQNQFQDAQVEVWWSDIMSTSTLAFEDNALERRFEQQVWCAANNQGRVCMLEAVLGMAFVVKAVYQTHAAHKDFVQLPLQLAALTTVSRLVPAGVLLWAPRNMRVWAALHYRVWRYTQTLIVVLMGMVCASDVDCQVPKGFLLELWLLMPVLTPFIAPLPFKLHLPLQIVACLWALVCTSAAQPWGACTLLCAHAVSRPGTAASTNFGISGGLASIFKQLSRPAGRGMGNTAASNAIDWSMHGVWPQVATFCGGIAESLVSLVAPANMLVSLRSGACRSQGTGPTDSSCTGLAQGLQGFANQLRTFVYLLVPMDVPGPDGGPKGVLEGAPKGPIPITNYTLPGLQWFEGSLQLSPIVKHPEIAPLCRSCILAGVVYISLVCTIVSCLLYNWELRSRMRFWTEESGQSVQLYPTFRSYRSVLWLQQFLLILVICTVIGVCISMFFF